MRIGIITILKVNNYGAELQAYATQAILKKLGYEAEIIDYLFYKNPAHKRTAKGRPVFPFSFTTKVKEWLYPKMMAVRTFRHRKEQRERARRFELFHQENTSTSKTYRSMDELYAAKMDYDVYLTGSDQVWNPGVYSSLDPYFLTFAPKGKKRISYAASFGVSQLPDYATAYYRRQLRNYAAIGVREKDAVEMVKAVSNQDAKWVLDPTLLLSWQEWMSVAKPYAVDGDYILMYELTPCPYIRQLAEYFQMMKGWRIVRVCKNANPEDKEGEIWNILDAGPAEFLSLLAHAALVITNSFHGTAFSVNFQRDFYTILPLRKQNNSRQRSLLELLALTDRLLLEGAPWPDVLTLEIDYTNASKRLEEERHKSIDFLKNAIDGE